MSKSTEVSGGVSGLGLLTIVFITLKLLGKIDWNWFWVLAPTTFPLFIVGIFIVFALMMHVMFGTKRR